MSNHKVQLLLSIFAVNPTAAGYFLDILESKQTVHNTVNIDAAFSWHDTPQGANYWLKISEALR